MTPHLPDGFKTLEELEGQVWGEPESESHLVLECHRLRRVPLREFTPANLRIMVGQSIGLEFLVPLALQLLADDPLLDAELYAGDPAERDIAVRFRVLVSASGPPRYARQHRRVSETQLLRARQVGPRAITISL